MELTDKFSWRRVWMLWRLYLPSLRKQLWAFPLVSFLLSIVAVLIMQSNPNVGPSGMTMTFGVTIMYFFAPIALARRDYRPLSDQMPVLASEKMVFLAVYFLLVTLVLTYGVQMLVSSLASHVFNNFCAIMNDAYGLASTVISDRWMYFTSYICGMAMPSLTLMGILIAKRSRILIGVLCGLGGYMALCFTSGLIGAFMAVYEIRDIIEDPVLRETIGENAEFVLQSMKGALNVVMIFASVYCVTALAVSWTIIYKKVKRGGF